MKNQNIIAHYLEILKVKFTKTYLHKLIDLHPYKDTFFGFSDVLLEYGIKSSTLKIKEKEELKEVSTPFITNIGNKFIVVSEVTENSISYLENDNKRSVALDVFFDNWGGVALVSKPTGYKSTEPNYSEHKRQELFDFIRNKVLFISLIFLFLFGIIYNGILKMPSNIIPLVLNLIGLYIGYLLLQKQLFIQNDNADKICSLVKNGGCNKILFSSASKFFGVLGWSEVGLGYFSANLMILTFAPSLIPYSALINCCALPYTLWSIWYQKFKAKEWCPLCLIVQILLWLLFITNLALGYLIIVPDQIDILRLFATGSLFAIPILLINLFIPYFIDRKRLDLLMQKYNKLRIDEDVFKSKLVSQTYYNVDKDVSNITWGNKNAKNLITIITNPHCEPCAFMHSRVKEFLNKVGDKICVQYIFSSFFEELESSSAFLIAIYLSEDIDAHSKERIFEEWFKEGKYNREDFFQKYNVDIQSNIVKAECEKQDAWLRDIEIEGTPTILFNGYKLPAGYSLENMRYFVDLDIE